MLDRNRTGPGFRAQIPLYLKEGILSTTTQINVLEGVTGTAPIVAGAVTAKSQAISITAATSGAAGSMSATDKTKLDAYVRVLLADTLASDKTVAYGTTGVWTDFYTGLSFTVVGTGSEVFIDVRGVVFGTSTAGVGNCASRLVVDSTNYLLGGTPYPAGNYGNALAGAGRVRIAGLAAGSHTLKFQVLDRSQTGNFYCRPATSTETEFLITTVTEIRQ